MRLRTTRTTISRLPSSHEPAAPGRRRLYRRRSCVAARPAPQALAGGAPRRSGRQPTGRAPRRPYGPGPVAAPGQRRRRTADQPRTKRTGQTTADPVAGPATTKNAQARAADRGQHGRAQADSAQQLSGGEELLADAISATRGDPRAANPPPGTGPRYGLARGHHREALQALCRRPAATTGRRQPV